MTTVEIKQSAHTLHDQAGGYQQHTTFRSCSSQVLQ